MSLVWLGSWYQFHFDSLHCYCLKTCLKALGFFSMAGVCHLLHRSVPSFARKDMHVPTEYFIFIFILYVLGWLLITSCFSPDKNTWGANTDNFRFLFIVKIKLKLEVKNWGWSQSAPALTFFRAYLTANEQWYFPSYICRTGLTMT